MMNGLRIKPSNLFSGFLSLIWLVIVIVPIYFAVLSSFKTQSDYRTEPLFSFPDSIYAKNYSQVWEANLGQYFFNSAFVTAISSVIIIVLAVMAAYAIVRNASKKALRVFSIFLLGLAIPAQAVIVPLAILTKYLAIKNTLWAIIFPATAFALPITMLILVTYLRDIPSSLFESMTLDGASNFKILFVLVIPLLRPAITTIAVYNALGIWNNFIFALILDDKDPVIPLALNLFKGEYTSNTPAILACVIISLLPLLAAYIIGRKQMVAGLSAGFGK
ncbi:MAG: carbohydrate ABC transporter permease [Clostridiales Family XIII bacterium]|jgi:raffinose/stachyose/melibiose transport system permease protein|nr:carbohydrate ABC transporter permease [Clostridiales Family XIII bacterium]